MKQIFTILFALGIFLISFQPVSANEPVAGSSAMLKNEVFEIEKADPRVKKLENYLNELNSPLASYAPTFIKAADKNELDWKLVPAITGVESTFGKNIPASSFNAYGWANGAYAFESWDQSINHVSRVLKEKYVDRGLDTPNKMGPVYAPPSSTWAGKVNFFMNQIEYSDQNKRFGNFSLTI